MSEWWFRFLESAGATLLVPLPVPVLLTLVVPRLRASSSVLTLCDRSSVEVCDADCELAWGGCSRTK